MSDPFFDSNILIDWLRDIPAASAELGRYNRHRISRVVWAELLAAEPIEQRETLQQIIAPFEVVEIDARIAAAAADIRRRAKMNLMDAFILATAQVNGAILVTRNTQDFPANMPGIRVPYHLRRN
ncbi:PIN domain-containing protein [Pelagerythrobacter sp.]|uniref:PIN domain-containing protein n=1 Tax=Pelagerythrobacter sp. TaxID=2800702 RepID=UPI0035AE72C3